MLIPFEWRLNDIERAANKACNRLWELDEANSQIFILKDQMCEIKRKLDNVIYENEQLKYSYESLLMRVSSLEQFSQH